jgi:hypothetical protein
VNGTPAAILPGARRLTKTARLLRLRLLLVRGRLAGRLWLSKRRAASAIWRTAIRDGGCGWRTHIP